MHCIVLRTHTPCTRPDPPTDLLAWLTAPDHDHSGPPPGDKWERACVDRTGDVATWGLRPHMIAQLRESPPPPAVALQARVAALYPEYVVAHMPCEVSNVLQSGT